MRESVPFFIMYIHPVTPQGWLLFLLGKTTASTNRLAAFKICISPSILPSNGLETTAAYLASF